MELEVKFRGKGEKNGLICVVSFCNTVCYKKGLPFAQKGLPFGKSKAWIFLKVETFCD